MYNLPGEAGDETQSEGLRVACMCSYFYIIRNIWINRTKQIKLIDNLSIDKKERECYIDNITDNTSNNIIDNTRLLARRSEGSA